MRWRKSVNAMQEFREADYAADIPGGSITAPYGRLEIVEDCITYFLEDEQ